MRYIQLFFVGLYHEYIQYFMQASAAAEHIDKVYMGGASSLAATFPASEEKDKRELDNSVMEINIDSLVVMGEMDDTFDTHGEDALRSIDQVIAQMPPNSKSLETALVRKQFKISYHFYVHICMDCLTYMNVCMN